MHTLRLYLTPGSLEAGMPWAVRDVQGRVLASGDGGDDWPNTLETELILSAGQTRFSMITLPEGVRPSEGEPLGYALEDGLINEPGENLYVLGESTQEGRHWVALTAAAPLCQARAWLKARGRVPERIVPEEMLLPAPAPGQWSLARVERGCLLRQGRARALFIPDGAASLFAPQCASEAPLSLLVCAETPVPAPLAMTPRETLPAYDWRAMPIAPVVDFAQGAFASRQAWRQWRPALQRMAWVLLTLIVLECALNVAETGWLAWRQQRLSTQIVAQATAVGVSATTPAEALARVNQLLEQRRMEHGLPARGGWLALMSALDQVAGAGLHIESLDYAAGQLTLVADGVSDEVLAQWRPDLSARQVSLERNPAGQLVLKSAQTEGGT